VNKQILGMSSSRNSAQFIGKVKYQKNFTSSWKDVLWFLKQRKNWWGIPLSKRLKNKLIPSRMILTQFLISRTATLGTYQLKH